MAARRCPSWADFQPELLGLVLRRLPSLADRVRLGAVCRPWRRGARLEPVPPPFPWLTLLDGTFLSVPDGEVHCIPVAPPVSYHCHGSIGDWLFLQHADATSGEPSMSLMNLFSEDVVRLPNPDAIWRHEPVDDFVRRPILYKPVELLSSMDAGLSPDSLFAVLITDSYIESVISIYHSTAAAAFRVPGRERILDVALLDGKLYALSPWKLFVVEVGPICRAGKPSIPSMKFIADAVDNPGMMCKTIAGESYDCAYWTYLAESSGKLLHVRRLIGHLSSLPEDEYKGERTRTLSFEVFEVDLTTDSRVQWRRLDSLGGKALFVGPHTKSLQASDCGAQPDCIYFICDYDWLHSWADPLRDCGVFNMRNGTIMPLLPENTVMRPKGAGKGRSEDKFYSARPAWFFPM